MVTLWNTLVRFKDVTYEGEKPLLRILQEIEQNGKLNDFLAWSGANNTNPAYESIAANVLPAWGALLLMIAIFTVVSVTTGDDNGLQREETNLGDLCADAYRDQSGADRMGLRQPLP